MVSSGHVKFALLGSVLFFSGISYYVAVTFGVVSAPHKYWKQMFTRMKDRDFDTPFLCNVDDTKDCTDREKKYIEKLKAKPQLEIQKQFARLNGMKDTAMSAELKQWLHQRLNILKGLGAVEIKPWRVCDALDTTDCTHKERVYIEKMKGKTLDEIKKEHERLESMKGDAMSAELKKWLHQRLRILEGLRALPVKDEVNLWRVIKQWLYRRLGLRAPPVKDEVKPWRVKKGGDLKEEAKQPDKKEEPDKEVEEAEKKQEESPKEEKKGMTTAFSDGEEEILEL